VVGDVPRSLREILIDPSTVLSQKPFFRLLKEATPGEDLQNAISQIEPQLLFRQDAPDKTYRLQGGYYLIPLLHQLEKHVVCYCNTSPFLVLTDFQNSSFLTFMRLSSNISMQNLHPSSLKVVGSICETVFRMPVIELMIPCLTFRASPTLVTSTPATKMILNQIVRYRREQARRPSNRQVRLSEFAGTRLRT